MDCYSKGEHWQQKQLLESNGLHGLECASLSGRIPTFEKRIDKLGYIKIKSFHSSNNTTIKIKMTGTNWKIFVIQKVSVFLNRVPTNQL